MDKTQIERPLIQEALEEIQAIMDQPTIHTDIYDMIMVNGRISKKLFQKVVEPSLDRGFKAIEENQRLKDVIREIRNSPNPYQYLVVNKDSIDKILK